MDEHTRQMLQLSTIEKMRDTMTRKKVKKWVIHTCTVCKYPCGFLFSDDLDTVRYDAGCYCTMEKDSDAAIRQSDWYEVSDFYMSQKTEKVVTKMNKFWEF